MISLPSPVFTTPSEPCQKVVTYSSDFENASRQYCTAGVRFLTRLFVYNLLYSPEFNRYSKQQPTSMEGTVRTTRSYKKNPVITVPQTLDYLKQLLPSAPSSSLPPSPNDTRGPPSTTLGSLLNERGWLDGSSS